MDQRSIINGRRYTFSKQLPSLDDGGILVVCTDDDGGGEYICSDHLWRSGVMEAEQIAPVHSQSSAQEKIMFFLSMFKGREGIYAKRYYSVKSGKSGYTPVCKNEWVEGLCDKRMHRCPECSNREFIPLSYEAIKAHLLGRDVAAVYPMLEDSKTWLLVVDFDKENWKLDVAAFCKTCEDIGLTPAVERSRSGNGAHIWFFFSEPVPAADARRLGSGLLTYTMACRHEVSFSSYDRLFPSQDHIPNGGFGNLIALPFQGQAQKNGNSLFVDSQFTPYTDQWAFLSSLPKISPDQLEVCVKWLCRDGDLGELVDTDEKHEPWTRRRPQKRLKIYAELVEEATVRAYGSEHYYALEMVIAVGFRINNQRAVQFRKWANTIARNYIIKGWVMDDERLKNGGSVLSKNYFDELLERIREIRLSERVFYQKITDIYATALDYDRNAKTTKEFFAKVQNRCTSLFMATPPPRSFTSVPTRTSPTWA